jgi:hypothetical protein
LRLTHAELCGVIGSDAVRKAESLRTTDLNLSHVTDIKQSNGTTYRSVLFDDSRILHRHVPTPEVHHPGFHAPMDRVQGRDLQRLGFVHENPNLAGSSGPVKFALFAAYTS